jgi:hypothetical protein
MKRSEVSVAQESKEFGLHRFKLGAVTTLGADKGARQYASPKSKQTPKMKNTTKKSEKIQLALRMPTIFWSYYSIRSNWSTETCNYRTRLAFHMYSNM